MKVKELQKVLSSVNPNWDVMIKLDDSADSRDLINGYELKSINDNMGFIQLTSYNKIGFGSQDSEEKLFKIYKLLHNVDEDDFSAEVAHVLGETIC